jgi:hypothetical protein
MAGRSTARIGPPDSGSWMDNGADYSEAHDGLKNIPLANDYLSRNLENNAGCIVASKQTTFS